jgi:hypothetical protein
MLAEIKNPGMYIIRGKMRSSVENGLCWLYKTIFDEKFDYNFKDLLPELSKYEDADWWGDLPANWEIRKKVLKQKIEETQ